MFTTTRETTPHFKYLEQAIRELLEEPFEVNILKRILTDAAAPVPAAQTFAESNSQWLQPRTRRSVKTNL